MNILWKEVAAAVGLLALLGQTTVGLAASDAPSAVGEGVKVSLEYTLSLPDKTVLESNVGKEPVTYTHGNREIIPGLEKALSGMKVGEKKHVNVSAEEAYGPYDEKKKVTVTKEQVPADVKVGTKLRSPDGMEAKIVAIEGDSVVVDTNHPLAGKALVFDVNILKLERQPPAAK